MPAAIVQVDDLEREDSAVPEVVQEDPDLDEPQLAGETKTEAVRHSLNHGAPGRRLRDRVLRRQLRATVASRRGSPS